MLEGGIEQCHVEIFRIVVHVCALFLTSDAGTQESKEVGKPLQSRMPRLRLCRSILSIWYTVRFEIRTGVNSSP